jgi:hypothetical protein
MPKSLPDPAYRDQCFGLKQQKSQFRQDEDHIRKDLLLSTGAVWLLTDIPVAAHRSSLASHL